MKPSQKKTVNNLKPPQKTEFKKVGRPSLGRDARIVAVTLKLSMNEKQLWERQAKALGMGLHEYILHPLRSNADEEGNNK